MEEVKVEGEVEVPEVAEEVAPEVEEAIEAPAESQVIMVQR